MRRIIGLALVVACGGGAPPAPGAPAVPAGQAGAAVKAGSRTDVTMQQFIARHPEGLQIVDVRTDGEYASGHIPGTVHVPLDQLSADHPEFKKLDPSKPVYFVCAVGGRSAKASDQMAAAGFQAVNVQGGTNAWVEQGQPVQKP